MFNQIAMQRYTIANVTMEVPGIGFNHIQGFPLFLSRNKETQVNLVVCLGSHISGWNWEPLHRFMFEEIPCEFTYTDGRYYYRKIMQGGNDLLMEISLRGGRLHAVTNMDERTPAHWLRFAVWIAFGIAAATMQTVAIHASTITYKGKSILFLGESGTGKSTHTRLWLKHIPEAELLNDDSPFVYADENSATVFGSPWSGKTPCFKNIQTPIAGIVRLSQATHNKINKLSGLAAIGALLPSCPAVFSCEEFLFDQICKILSSLIQQIPVYSLECLPNEDAAQLVFSALKNDGYI